MRQPMRMRELLRVSALVEKPVVAREIILEWLENKAETDLPEQAWKGRAFSHKTGSHSFTAVRAKDRTTDMWALRFVEPDTSGVEREWTTEVAVSPGGRTGRPVQPSHSCQVRRAQAPDPANRP